MMEFTTLLESAAITENGRFHLLMEGGAQTNEKFQVFYAEHSAQMHSLYLHPQLADIRNYGPWVFAVQDKNDLGKMMETIPGIVGVIASPDSPGLLAARLSVACTMIRPDEEVALVRFYSRKVISLLAQCHDQEWHSFMFNGITQWWVPEEVSWQQITLLASTAENPQDHAVRPGADIWQKIEDKPEVGSVLNQWQKMPASQHFPPCSQRDMVTKALEKAREAGMPEGVNVKLYALYYLNGGKKILESEEMQLSLQKVREGKTSLTKILTGYSAS